MLVAARRARVGHGASLRPGGKGHVYEARLARRYRRILLRHLVRALSMTSAASCSRAPSRIEGTRRLSPFATSPASAALLRLAWFLGPDPDFSFLISTPHPIAGPFSFPPSSCSSRFSFPPLLFCFLTSLSVAAAVPPCLCPSSSCSRPPQPFAPLPPVSTGCRPHPPPAVHGGWVWSATTKRPEPQQPRAEADGYPSHRLDAYAAA